MSFYKNNTEDLFKRHRGESMPDKHNQSQSIEDIRSWDGFFYNVWEKPIDQPRKVTVYIKRFFPALAQNNPLKVEFYVPYLFGFFDRDNNRWLGMITSTGKDYRDWEFILFIPNEKTYLSYLSGETDLISVFKTAKNGDYYISRPLTAQRFLVKLKANELSKHQIPNRGAFYSNNIWFDKNDLLFGMNLASSQKVIEFAREGKFL